jgi:propionyl-CoA carboxylase alpha chain
MITGIDLVKLQIKVAEGETLPIKQDDLRIGGHAIEVRVYAEDPSNNFLPDIGTLKTYVRPQGNGVRVDDGFEEGMAIPFYYDPMISKLVCHAETREHAMDKTIRAIDEYEITGIETTLGFCRYVLSHKAFRSGKFDTKFVEQYFSPEVLKPPADEEEQLLAAAFSATLLQNGKKVSMNSYAAGGLQQGKWKKNRTK